MEMAVASVHKRTERPVAWPTECGGQPCLPRHGDTGVEDTHHTGNVTLLPTVPSIGRWLVHKTPTADAGDRGTTRRLPSVTC